MNTCSSLDLQIGKAAKEPFKCDGSLCSGELESQAKMHAGTERKMGIRAAGNIELVRPLEFGGVAICRCKICCEHVTAAELTSLPSQIASRKAGLGHLHGLYVAEAFLDTRWQ